MQQREQMDSNPRERERDSTDTYIFTQFPHKIHIILSISTVLSIYKSKYPKHITAEIDPGIKQIIGANV